MKHCEVNCEVDLDPPSKIIKNLVGPDEQA